MGLKSELNGEEQGMNCHEHEAKSYRPPPYCQLNVLNVTKFLLSFEAFEGLAQLAAPRGVFHHLMYVHPSPHVRPSITSCTSIHHLMYVHPSPHVRPSITSCK